MSKKKSYMDRENILSEGLFKMLGKLIPFKKLIKKAFSSKEDKSALKDPGVMRALGKFNTAYNKAKKESEEFDQMMKDYKAGKDIHKKNYR